jgi:APA family basic amino acid/polyamine antiporter
MLNLPAETWIRFAVWMVLGFIVYFVYGRSHSRLGRSEEAEHGAPHSPGPNGE